MLKMSALLLEVNGRSPEEGGRVKMSRCFAKGTCPPKHAIWLLDPSVHDSGYLYTVYNENKAMTAQE